MSTVTERETATFVQFGLICSTAATAIPLKPIANRSPHERLVWRRLSRTCGTDLLRFCGLWGFFADARRENAMRWSCAGRKGTKPLLVGIMPGNGRDRVTDGSCERHESRSRIETAEGVVSGMALSWVIGCRGERTRLPKLNREAS